MSTRRILFVATRAELPFATLVAAALERFHAVECDAAVFEGVPSPGSVQLVRGKTTVKRVKTQLEITARSEVRGGKEPLRLKVVLGIEGAQDDDPSEYEGEIASSVARRVKPVFDEQDVPARRDVALYSLWCGAPFGEALLRALSAAGFQCEVRPLNPGEYPASGRPWGRIAPGPVIRSEGSVEVRKTTFALGERGVEVRSIKVKTPVGAEEGFTHDALAAKVVARLQKFLAQVRA